MSFCIHYFHEKKVRLELSKILLSNSTQSYVPASGEEFVQSRHIFSVPRNEEGSGNKWTDRQTNAHTDRQTDIAAK